MPRARLRKNKGRLVYGTPNSREEAVLDSAKRAESFLWDFSADGASDFLSGRYLPANAIIKSITLDIQTAVTGATDALFKCGAQTLTASTDLTALSGIATVALTDTDGIKVTSANSEISLDFTAAPTAGAFRVFLEYLSVNE